MIYNNPSQGRLAQLVAQHDHTVKVGGSNPSSPTSIHQGFENVASKEDLLQGANRVLFC